MNRFRLRALCLVICSLTALFPPLPARALTLGQLLAKCEEARSLSQYDTLSHYSRQLLAQADASRQPRAVTYACFYNGLALLFEGQGTEALAMLDRAEQLSLRHGNDSVLALVLNARAIHQAVMEDNSFVAQQYFFRSLAKARAAGFEDLQQRVRGNLLTLSHSMTGDIALDNAREVYDYGIKTGSNEQASMGAYYLASYYYKADDYDEAERYIRIALDIYRQYPYEDIASVYSLYAKVLLTAGRSDEAVEQAREGIRLAQRYRQASMEVDALITYAEVLHSKGQHQASIAQVLQAIAKAEETGISNKSIDCHQLLAADYRALGQQKEAIEHLLLANELLTAQSSINMERLAHEQQVMHDIEQRELDSLLKQEQIQAQRQFLLMMGVIMILLVAIIINLVIQDRRTKSLYRKIVIQNTRAIARQEELQAEIDLLNRERASVEADAPEAPAAAEADPLAADDTPLLDEAKTNVLYFKLCHLMEDKRLYAEAQLTRERMAECLGTNRTYLTRVIKEKTGMNYLQFLNSYRINEAIRILSDKDKVDYPLKQIWSDLGFTSPSTFFKHFQQAVGLTPSAYRKQFLEVNDADMMDEEEEHNLEC